MRIFPTQIQKEKLQEMFNQFRWCYNSALTILFNHYGYKNVLKRKSFSFYTIRNLIKKYSYRETIQQGKNVILKFIEFIYDENHKKGPQPHWWKKINDRLYRGAIKKFIMALNSALSNLKAKNIKKFKMKYLSKKNPLKTLHFEDCNYPKDIKGLTGRYWYTTRDRKRKAIELSDIDCQERGLEVIYEKSTRKYFVHYPVDRDWFPEDDIRNDKQVKLSIQKKRIISLDPGIRKFLVGYDPKGKAIFIGQGAQNRLISCLLEIDELISLGKNPHKKWKKLKNLVSELHYKVINFLIKNYDIILLPDFRISQMIKKKNIGRMTKRLMCMFSFHSFKEKLKWKCSIYDKQLIIVDESYTSKTCGCCGELNELKSKETFTCKSCKMEIDRDVNGARNILIKNITLR